MTTKLHQGITNDSSSINMNTQINMEHTDSLDFNTLKDGTVEQEEYIKRAGITQSVSFEKNVVKPKISTQKTRAASIFTSKPLSNKRLA